MLSKEAKGIQGFVSLLHRYFSPNRSISPGISGKKGKFHSRPCNEVGPAFEHLEERVLLSASIEPSVFESLQTESSGPAARCAIVQANFGNVGEPGILGDYNCDGVVSAGDLAYAQMLGVDSGEPVGLANAYTTVQSNFGAVSLESELPIEGTGRLPGDANDDGVVSAGDYASVQANFGSTGIVLTDPYVDVRGYASFSDAVAAIGTTNATLLIPDLQNVDSNVFVGTNITLEFLQGGSLYIGSNITLAIGGEIDAGLHNIFQGSGNVVFGTYSNTSALYPQWFGAKLDGATDDIDAMEKTVACLQASGGGEIHITNKMVIGRTLVFTGSIQNLPAQSPNYYGLIKVKGTGPNAGIYGTVSTGNLVQLGTTGNDNMEFRLDLEDLIIDGGMRNVTVIHGGVNDGNHTVNFDNLLIKGFSGSNSVGIDSGRITDSMIRNVVVQGQGSGKGIVARRSTMQLMDCRILYAEHGLYIPNTQEANAQMIGGGILVCQNCITFEGPSPSWNANYFMGTFLGENRVGTKIVNVVNPAPHGKDIAALTFQGCLFSSEDSSQPLLDFSDFYGPINLIGCAVWGQSLSTIVRVGPNVELVMIGNANLIQES